MGFLFSVNLLLSFVISDNPLNAYQWQNRIIIIEHGIRNENGYRQMDLLVNYPDKIKDRDMVIIQLVKDKVKVAGRFSNMSAVQIRDYYDLKPELFQVLLIGKDSGIKLRSNEVLPPEEFFDLIDTMPMRKAEMRRDNK